MPKVILTESEKWTVINGLRCAADAYQGIADRIRTERFRAREVSQFELQRQNVLAMAEYFEQAERIEVFT